MLNLLILLQSLLPGTGGGGEAAPALGKIGQDISELKTLSANDLINKLADMGVKLVINLAIAILVFYVGRFIIRKLYKFISTIFVRRRIERSLSTFILSLVNIVLYFILIVTVIGILGIETTSFLALFASAGVAVGMALSGTLQNFAGGVLILLLKPYKIGDYIEAQGYAGTVKEIQIFFTVITTYDNKSVLIPNGGLSTASINNWSKENYRRVSWTISISYGDDVTQARQAILDMFASDSRVRKDEEDEAAKRTAGIAAGGGVNEDSASDEVKAEDGAGATDMPEPPKPRWYKIFSRGHRKAMEARAEWEQAHNTDLRDMLPNPVTGPRVFVDSLAASSVDLTVRAWTLSSDYWAVYYYYNELFYSELPKKGIHFPFPQMDVHINQI